MVVLAGMKQGPEAQSEAYRGWALYISELEIWHLLCLDD